MSNSAFTPTQIEVTNEVPVNVPVVTAWEAYTPTLTSSGGGSVTLNATGKVDPYGRWRRVGDSIEIELGFENGSGGAASGTAGNILLSIPSGITIDSTKIKLLSGFITPLGHGSVSSGSGYSNGQSASYLSSSNRIALIKGATATFYQVSDVIASFCIGIKITLPVAEWAGSGTTTLATRAVEEYAWSTDATTTAGNTQTDNGLYGNGPAGIRFYSFASTTANSRTTKRVRFQSPILATDTVIFEYSENAGLSWYAASNGFISVSFAGSSIYGVNIVPVSGSTTDYYVQFGNRGYLQSNATYGGDGNAWSILAGNVNYLWRVRKVSGGAQVGYPVSARNIVGDTSGSVVPTGMLGEEKKITNNSTIVTNSVTQNTWYDVSGMTIELTPGIWDISATSRINAAYYPTFGTIAIGMMLGIRQGSTVISAADKLESPNQNYGASAHICLISTRVIVTTNTTYKMSFSIRNAYGSPATIPTVTIDGRNDALTVLRAVRIA